MKITVEERKYKFFDYVEELHKQGGTVLNVTKIDNAVFVEGKEVATVFITSEHTHNDVFMKDDDYFKEVDRVIRQWVKYYGFKGDIMITKNAFKKI